jgi:hypothetical protein
LYDLRRRRFNPTEWRRSLIFVSSRLPSAGNAMATEIKGVSRMGAGKWTAIALSLAVLGFTDGSAAQEAQKLFIEGDIVRGNTPSGITGPVCVLANQFKRRENVIFRIRVRNVAGQPLDDEHIKSIVVELSDGKKFPARYGSRPPNSVLASVGLTAPTDHFWSAAWLISQDYPTGSLGYRVVATDMQGNTQTWTPFNDPRSLPFVMSGDVEFVK